MIGIGICDKQVGRNLQHDEDDQTLTRIIYWC